MFATRVTGQTATSDTLPTATSTGPTSIGAASTGAGSPSATVTGVVLSSAAVTEWMQVLRRVDPDLDDGERIHQIRALEELKSAAAAAQARITADFAVSQRDLLAAAGAPVADQGRSITAQVALARRDSPHRGGRHLGLAQALTSEMPHTLAGLQAGLIGEWRATIMVRETACLTREHREVVDTELGPRLGALGDAATAREARRIGYRLDAGSVMARIRGAVSDRRVSIRPAPDTMALLTGLLPACDGIAAHLALRAEADRLKATGDPRGRGQIMADTLVQRVTGKPPSSTDTTRRQPLDPTEPHHTTTTAATGTRADHGCGAA